MPSWLDVVVDSRKYTESPPRFYWWAAACVIAATLKKNVFLNKYSYNLYPNIYVLLVSAKSGLRKGVPVSFAGSMLELVGNTRVITGQNSIQGIVKEFSTQRTLESGQVFNEAQGIILAPELGSSMIKDTGVWTMLTDLYNTHEWEKQYTKTLRNSPTEVLKQPCICFLAASNEPLLEDALQQKDIEGGFVARTFMIHESKKGFINPLVDPIEGFVPKEILAQHLMQLKNVKGGFTWSPLGKELYKSWYMEIMSIDHEDRTGTTERIGDAVLKLAMIISMAKGTELILREEDIFEAIEKCEGNIPGVRQITASQGKSEEQDGTALVLKLLLDSPNNELTRKKVLQKLMPDIDYFAFDRIVEKLKEAGAILEPRRLVVEGKARDEIVYQLSPETAANYMKFKRAGVQ